MAYLVIFKELYHWFNDLLGHLDHFFPIECNFFDDVIKGAFCKLHENNKIVYGPFPSFLFEFLKTINFNYVWMSSIIVGYDLVDLEFIEKNVCILLIICGHP